MSTRSLELGDEVLEALRSLWEDMRAPENRVLQKRTTVIAVATWGFKLGALAAVVACLGRDRGELEKFIEVGKGWAAENNEEARRRIRGQDSG